MDRSADNLGQIINDIQRELEELKTTQLRVRETLYPVGSIYMSATAATTSEVAAMFGGTWEAWGVGRTLVGVDPEDEDFAEAELTGGEKTHTLTVDEMPSHRHNIGQTYSGYRLYQDGSAPNGIYTGYATSEPTNYVGGGEAHNNLQPYITCYMFKRIA